MGMERGREQSLPCGGWEGVPRIMTLGLGLERGAGIEQVEWGHGLKWCLLKGPYSKIRWGEMVSAWEGAKCG